MALKVKFESADEFKLAWADYGLSEDALSLLKRNIARNPVIGKASKNDPQIRRCRFRQHVVAYTVLDTNLDKGEVVIWLLNVTPAQEPQSALGRWSRRALAGAAWVMRFRRGDLPGDDDDE
ncbi:hypothetical protein FQ775_06230 [Nitratireductor mangrovi]|uniref:Type II toxin-antitoxin system RelE/ParE family toxin n=1 Tax=Nitratireductor mangrovi TaxID=2599600 RepID=A0A5B8KWB3_9HYPH|nr:hypothetical protein [Nitratireductor mangrovi]QDZ00007.1 hypothetical protein FQ775_06230 [Nitratireductor mangrovi]